MYCIIFLRVSDDRMIIIFIVVDSFIPQPTFILELFNFKWMNPALQEWLPIEYCMMHIHNEVVSCKNVMYFHAAMVR